MAKTPYRMIIIFQDGTNKVLTFPGMPNDETAKQVFRECMDGLSQIDPRMSTLKSVVMYNKSVEVARWIHIKYAKKSSN